MAKFDLDKLYKILDGDFLVGQPHKSLFRLGCHFRDVVRGVLL